MSAILPLTAGHSAAVAGLHMANLSTPLRGAPGRHLLEAYYRVVAHGQGATGFVAVVDDQVIGYVCGVWAPERLRAVMLKTEWPQLALWAPLSLLRQPRLLASWLQRLRTTPPTLPAAAAAGYELRPIVVAPAVRGAGVAAALVARLVQDASDRGYVSIHLLTELNNRTARAFYAKTGFSETGQLQRSGIEYVCYARPLVAGSL